MSRGNAKKRREPENTRSGVTGDVRVKRAGDPGADDRDDRYQSDEYFFDEEDTPGEDSLYKPAPPLKNKPGTGKIKVEKIRRDDKGHFLVGGPIRMPEENLYYNRNGYIPQENINYAVRDQAEESILPRREKTGEGLFSKAPDFGEADGSEEAPEESGGADFIEAYPGSVYYPKEITGKEPSGAGCSGDDTQTGYDYEDDSGETAAPAGLTKQEGPGSAADPEGEREAFADSQEEEDDIFDGYNGDSWVTKFVPPPAEEPKKGKNTTVRTVLAACLSAAGLVLAIGAGCLVALLDLDKTGADLLSALRGTYISELSEEYKAELRLADKEEEALSEDVTDSEQPAEEAEAEEQEPSGDDAYEEAEAGLADNMEISGISAVVDAGSGDEIVIAGKGTVSGNETLAVAESADPNAGYPSEYTEVDYGYFLDALFVGDSRLQGFGMYADLPATYYCVTSFSVYKYDTMKVVQTDAGKVPIFDALPYDMFTKIYIKVGLNEMGGNEELFFERYAELIARLREYEPRAIVYVHAILPVTNAKSASDRYHNNPAIHERNEKLKAFAAEQKAYYIDVSPAIALEDGSLPPEATSDGIHLKASYMEPWKEYLRTHAIAVQN
ncbi:MAG TPA: hypothetical protein DCL38_07525 [Lachnospiraceae bacterium]|nr:hypothetical protein [Lachnospiraceae bacterium]